MQTRSIAIPRLLHVGSDCLRRLTPLLERTGFDLRQVAVGSGRGPSQELAAGVIRGLRDAGVEVSHHPGLSGQLAQTAELAARVIESSASLLVGVGGGRVIDTVKLAAARTGTDFVSVPTTMAHDGISSPVASLASRASARQSYAAAMPAGVIVDTAVIGSAPPRTLRSGAGDLASNLTAILDWQLADRAGNDRYDAFSAMIAESAALPVLELDDLSLATSHEVLAKGLLMSGLAMAAAGTSRPCSGAEHLISHSLDTLLGERAAMHGEQVALGCLISAEAHGSPLRDSFGSAFSRLGLPTSPEAVGITEAEMVAALEAAPATRPNRHTILNEIRNADSAALVERAFRASGSQQ